jgi:LysM repeat protein
MPYSNPLPFVGLNIQEAENASLEKIAQKYHVTKTELARAFMRAGMQNFDPEKVLALTKVSI